MLIERGQVIAGLEAVEARRLMRELMRAAMTPAAIAEAAGDDPSTVVRFEAFRDEGLIEPAERPDRICHVPEVDGDDPMNLVFWHTTVAGSALGKARIGKPMKRPKAEALLAELLARVDAVVEDPNCAFEVVSVEVFGSYLDLTREGVGDVDLRVFYRPRPDVDFVAANRAAVSAAQRADRHLTTIDHFGGLLERDLQSRLRGRSNRLDIQFDNGKKRPLPPGATVALVWPVGSTNS